MSAIGFSHYNLRAPRDLLECLCAFYVEVVGLEIGYRPPFGSFGYWLYAGGEAILHLSETRENDARSIATATTFDHAAFKCVGRADVEKMLAAKGIEYRLAHIAQTGQVQLFFLDPAGNGVELNFADPDA